MQKAFYRCSFGVIQRSKGDSVIKKAAYNAREKLRRDETKSYVNYSNKQDLLAKGILAPKGAKKWVFNRQTLYNKVEATDKRSNSQLGRTLDVGLLHQLTLEQNQELLERYLNKNFVSRGMVADYCIHAPDTDGDERNIHAHIILSMRHLDGEGFSRNKAREWNNKTLLEESRIAWAVEANEMFKSLDLPYYIDHRSLKDQGIDRLPQRHEGKTATNLKRRKGVIVSKVTHNDLVKQLNQIHETIDRLMLDEQMERVKKVRQYEELLDRCIILSQEAIETQEAETAYWVKQQELEGVLVEIEEINIAEQYFELRQKGITLIETIDREIVRTLTMADEESTAATEDKEATDEEPITVTDDNRKTKRKKSHKFQDWLDEETKELEAQPEYQEQNQTAKNLESEITEEDIEYKPPDLRRRDDLERTERSSTTYVLSEKIAEHTELEALTKAQKIKAHYKSTKNRTAKNVVTEYRLKLAEITAQYKPENVVKHFRDATPTAFNCERLIRDYLRRKGFNDVQIRNAMRRASPALYKQSEQQARKYARRFNEYLREVQEKERALKQQKQSQNLNKEKTKKRSRGRTR